MPDNGILEAEQRVREMNRMTRQYSEQGNRYLQSMRNVPPQTRQVRFEPAAPAPREKTGQESSSGGSGGIHGNVRDPVGSQPQHASDPTVRSSGSPNTRGGKIFFPDLTADGERIMILLLIYLLMRENSDIKLILALGYLLL